MGLEPGVFALQILISTPRPQWQTVLIASYLSIFHTLIALVRCSSRILTAFIMALRRAGVTSVKPRKITHLLLLRSQKTDENTMGTSNVISNLLLVRSQKKVENTMGRPHA